MSEETLTSTFIQMRRKFLRFASRFFPDEDDAADALQDAFCRLWPRRDAIATRQEAEAMAITAVRNLGIDAFRRRQSVQMLELDAERDSEAAESAADRMEREEQFRAVERIIREKLPETQQRILRMKEYEGESFQEIARKLGMEEPAVRMALSRARKTIRECYINLQK